MSVNGEYNAKRGGCIKRCTVLPWRDAPFQQQFASIRKEYEYSKDLYVTRNGCRSDGGRQEYDVRNDLQERLLYAECCSLEERPISLVIFSPDKGRKVIEAEQLKPFMYAVKQEGSVTGTLIVQKDRFLFLNTYNSVVYSANSVTSGEGYSVDLKDVPSLYYKVEHHLAIKSFDGRLLGKYFVALKNLDLSPDKRLRMDRSIAVAFAVLFEEMVRDRIRPPIVGIPR